MIRQPCNSSKTQLPRESHRYPSLRLRLTVVVNTALALLLIAFLIYDYQRELQQQVEARRIALEEEAKTLLHATLQMEHRGVPDYIDTVIADMEHSHVGNHFILVESNSSVVKASALDYDTHRVIESLRRATTASGRRAQLGEIELVVGVASAGNSTLYVAEDISGVRRSVLRGAARRSFGLVVLGLVGALIVNLVLFRLVTRPLNRLVAALRAVARGDTQVQADTFRTAEFNYLANEIDEMISALMANECARRVEMTRAREIQQHLMPKEHHIPGLDVAHLYQPADSVAGDYFDVLPFPDGTCLFCVADVTGHGIPAALTAAMLKTLLASASELHSKPCEILQYINKRLVAATPIEHFATMILVQVDTQQQTLKYTSAGHETAWLLTASGELVELASTGIPLGIQEDANWRCKDIPFHPGTRLLLVSDGIAEAFNLSARDVWPRTSWTTVQGRGRCDRSADGGTN